MSTGAGKAVVQETNSNVGASAHTGTKVTRLPGPAKGKTGPRNAGMDKTFRGGRGR